MLHVPNWDVSISFTAQQVEHAFEVVIVVKCDLDFTLLTSAVDVDGGAKVALEIFFERKQIGIFDRLCFLRLLGTTVFISFDEGFDDAN